LLIQELQVMNVQMRIITEDNIDQLLSMSYSNNINKLLQLPDDASLKDAVNKYVSEIKRAKEQPTAYLPPSEPNELPEPVKIETEIVSNPVPAVTLDSPAYVPESNTPRSDAVSPAYMPDSNEPLMNNSNSLEKTSVSLPLNNIAPSIKPNILEVEQQKENPEETTGLEIETGENKIIVQEDSNTAEKTTGGTKKIIL
jgi:hypothetical protein